MDVEATRAQGRFLALRDGMRIWYRFVPGTGPAAVLLHGIGGSSYPMRSLAAPFQAAGRATLLLDMRGHGFSDGPAAGGGFSLAEHCDDALSVIDACGVTEADVVGHCFGAMIAVRLASLRPGLVRRIVLVSGTLRPRDSLAAVLCWGAIGAAGRAFGALAPRRYGSRLQEQHDAAAFPRVSDVYPPRMRADFRRTSYRYGVATMMAMSREDLDDEAAGLTAPVLVVHGAHDAWVPWRNPKRSAERIPGARFELRPEDGHVSCVLRPGSTLPGQLLEFLRS